jgi:hypothetical protein
MIDFTSQQLSWLVVTLATVGGGGYITMNSKVDTIDKNVAVSMNSIENTQKIIDKMQLQLARIEDKIDQNSRHK